MSDPAINPNPSVGCQTEGQSDDFVILPKSQDVVSKTYFTDCDLLSSTDSETSKYYIIYAVNHKCGITANVSCEYESCPRSMM